MNTLKEFRNSLLKRNEVSVSFKHSGNPGFDRAGKNLAELFKVAEEQIAVKAVRGNFGANEFLIEAFIYDSAADKERTEAKKKEKKAVGGAN